MLEGPKTPLKLLKDDFASVVEFIFKIADIPSAGSGS